MQTVAITYCKAINKADPCPEHFHYIFKLVDEPMAALWHESKHYVRNYSIFFTQSVVHSNWLI